MNITICSSFLQTRALLPAQQVDDLQMGEEPLQAAPSVPSSDLLQTAWKRGLRAELVEIQALLDSTRLDDPFTESIRLWVPSFREVLGECDSVEMVKERYFAFLHELLVDDPSTAMDAPSLPLDDHPLLGSNGLLFNRKALCVALSALPVEDRMEWLYDVVGTRSFLLKAHPIAERMVSFLKEYDASFFQTEASLRIDLLYEELKVRRSLPLFPTLENAFIREQVLEPQWAAMRETKERRRETEKALSERIGQESQPLFAEIGEHFDAQIERVRNFGEEEGVKRRELEARIEALNGELPVLQEEVLLQKALMGRVQEEIRGTQEANRKLEEATRELKQALDNYKERKKNELIKTVAIAALCAAVTAGVTSALQMGMQPTLSAGSGGGIMGGVSFPV
ncbi:MAG: hypothetical protein KGI80_02510 [Verrucomicrobiota bacterium]|nr:hypothetical protein [Verrucomicrobiota bacterium]